ncbi:hypothetical protein PCE1_000320 [Barthelona sp. PCE]
MSEFNAALDPVSVTNRKYEDSANSCEFILSKMSFAAFPDYEFTEAQKNTVRGFLTNVALNNLFMYISAETDKIVVTTALPELSVIRVDEQDKMNLCFFIRTTPEIISFDVIQEQLHWANMCGEPHMVLLTFLKTFVVTAVSEERDWPESVKNEYISHLHRFLANFTEITYNRHDQTVLYIPDSRLFINFDIRDKVQIFEGCLIYWLHQIRDLLNESEKFRKEDLGVLEMIDILELRVKNLLSVQDQIESDAMVAILEALKDIGSNYYDSFIKLKLDLNSILTRSNRDMNFVSLLKDSIHELKALESIDNLEKVRELLLEILMVLKFVLKYAPHLEDILSKFGNELIVLCKRFINIDEFLDKKDYNLNNIMRSIKLLKLWKHMFVKLDIPVSNKETSSFSSVEAFQQRLEDLLEVLKLHEQFTNFEDKVPRNFRLTKSLDEIGILFLEKLNILFTANEEAGILSINNSEWYQHYLTFKNSIKYLNIIYTNLLSSQLTDNFHENYKYLIIYDRLASLQSIKTFVSKKKLDLWNMFNESIDIYKKEFEAGKKSAPLTVGVPLFSGSAVWARSMIMYLEEDLELLENLSIVNFDEAFQNEKASIVASFLRFKNTCEDYVRNQYTDWSDIITNNNLTSALDNVLMMRVLDVERDFDSAGMRSMQLQVNFEPELFKLLREVVLWQKCDFDIPYNAAYLFTHFKTLHQKNEEVLAVILHYNRILELLQDSDKLLFKERLSFVEKKFRPGLETLTWNSKNLRDYVSDCFQITQDILNLIFTFKENNFNIDSLFEKIANVELFKLSRKELHSLTSFNSLIKSQITSNIQVLQNTHNQIIDFFRLNFGLFQQDSTVTTHWFNYVATKEFDLLKALEVMIVKNFSYLNFLLNGSRKQEVIPLFNVFVVLKNNRCVLEPSVEQMTESFNSLVRDIMTVTRSVPRLVTSLNSLCEFSSALLTILEDYYSNNVGNYSRDSLVEHLSGYSEDDIDELMHQINRDPDLVSLYSFLAKDTNIRNLLNIIFSTLSDLNKDLELFLNGLQTKYKDVWSMDKKSILTAEKERLHSIREEFTNNVRSNLVAFQKEEIDELNGAIATKKFKRFIVPHATEEAPFDPNELEFDWKELIKQVIKDETHQESISKIFNALLLSEANILEQFIDRVREFKSLSVQIMQESIIVHKKFLHLDISKLKNLLDFYLNEWIQGFLMLINTVTEELINDVSKFVTDRKDITLGVGTLEQLDEAIRSFDMELKLFAFNTVLRTPVIKLYNELLNQSFTLDDSVIAVYDNLPSRYVNYARMLNSQLDNISEMKGKQKDLQMFQMKNFQKLVNDMKHRFEETAPYDSDLSRDAVFELLDGFKDDIAELVEQEKVIMTGLLLFNIHTEERKEIQEVSESLAVLESMWHLRFEFQSNYENWLKLVFKNIDIDHLDNEILGFIKRINKLGRILRNKNVWMTTKKEVESFKKFLPLLKHLKNPSMLTRHWKELKQHFGFDFDFNATLAEILGMNLKLHEDIIEQVSITATQEMLIFEDLKEIEQFWLDDELCIDVKSYKATYVIDNSSAVLASMREEQEKHTVKLTNIKNNKYSLPFMSDVEKWDKDLSTLFDNLDTWMETQKDFKYLENIFSLSDGISKQLPKTAAEFDAVSRNWHKLFIGFIEEFRCHAFHGLLWKQVAAILRDIIEALEIIQKQLEQYLETKRMAFPRFYFLSNDDLLEILGQSRNPITINKHINKCFDGVRKLIFNTDSIRKTIIAMVSMDGERLNLARPIPTDTNVEAWLVDVEQTMALTLKDLLQECVSSLRNYPVKREKWLKNWLGQLGIAASLCQWSADVGKSLTDIEKGQSKFGLKILRKRYMALLNRLTNMVRSDLSKVDRSKVVTAITMEVHSKDVIQKLITNQVSSPEDFDWTCQLRFGLVGDDVKAFQTTSVLDLGYEYFGNPGRLVITPLTDRCYLTLTTALALKFGGNPRGPAGTGKTETVKDMGRNLMRPTIVFNASEELDYVSLANSFSGLVQGGFFGCFDEFNRIEIDVLSVVAQQISSILNALAAGRSNFEFEGQMIPLNSNVGLFITMNPGYAGRTPLPDNLKSLFRPVAMMVPDLAMIAEIILYAQGFSKARVLSKKITTLYSLMGQQLSKQDHYDFGLRAIKGVLVTAGGIKRNEPDTSEDIILLRALRDSNIPKLVSDDIGLFLGLIQDLFPGIETVEQDRGIFQETIIDELRKRNLQPIPHMINKIVQLYETKVIRHGTMVVGLPGSGKSTAWEILQNTMTAMHKKDPKSEWVPVHTHLINPKTSELYGWYDLSTREWNDGVLSRVLREVSADASPDQKWIVFDGPIDTLWIESMNTVLDDSRILTLINAERISFPQQVSLLFETRDLSVASPATVSRCGMVYFDEIDLGWKPFVETWLEKRSKISKVNAAQEATLKAMFSKYVPRCVEQKRKWKELVPVSTLATIRSLTKLYDTLATSENNVTPENQDHFPRLIEMYFVFSLIWTLGASLDAKSRKNFDMFLRTIDGQFPPTDTVYDYHVDNRKTSWTSWTEFFPTSWKPSEGVPMHRAVVPTMDTVRAEFLFKHLLPVGQNVLVVGHTGVGKSIIIEDIIQKYKESNGKYISMRVNFSAQTSVESLQKIFERTLDHRGAVYLPKAGKTMICFIDDLNMPGKEIFGAQPPLELLRQFIDYGFWYDIKKQTKQTVKNMQLVGAMGPPGGGRQVICDRLVDRFHLINFAEPSQQSVRRIFGILLNQHLSVGFEDNIRSAVDNVCTATFNIYKFMKETMLPTPTKSHYIFSLRDVGKVFQGLLQCSRSYSRDQFIKLWIHECYRVFHDKLAIDQDRAVFRTSIQEQLSLTLDANWARLCENNIVTPFGSFMTLDQSYQELPSFEELREEVYEKQDAHNLESKQPLNLVLFKDAINHMCRIIRVLNQPQGNVLLIGVGGSGRKSLTRLASYIVDYEIFEIEMKKNYSQKDFYDDLRELFSICGIENQPTVFLFSDTQVTDEVFLEDINNILASGMVPGLYDDIDNPQEFYDSLRPEFRKNHPTLPETEENLWRFFVDRVRENLHVILCMSPIGADFRNRVRLYPALVSCTTIDWFSNWPADALIEVASNNIVEMIDYGIEDEYISPIAATLVDIHTSVERLSEKMRDELRRHNYVTPTNFLDLLDSYKQTFRDKRSEIFQKKQKLANGLSKLVDTRKEVEIMTIKLDKTKETLAKKTIECNELLVTLVNRKTEADAQKKEVDELASKLKIEEQECSIVAANAEKDLEEVMPMLVAASEALNKLSRQSLADIRAMQNPPAVVHLVLKGLMILRGSETDWATCRVHLANTHLLHELTHYPKENITDKMLKKLQKVTAHENFDVDKLALVSQPVAILADWILCMQEFAKVYRVVAPKKQALNRAINELEIKRAMLSDAQAKLANLKKQIQDLDDEYQGAMSVKEKLETEAKLTELKLDRAASIVNGLADERIRWQEQIAIFDREIELLPGDCLLAAAFLSYCGPFPSQYRSELVDTIWRELIEKANIPHSETFDFIDFLAVPTEVRDWNIRGLPSDSFSIENGVLVTRGHRWPLMIDPQDQANSWIKRLYEAEGLRIIDLKQRNFLRTLESSIVYGSPCLLENVSEDLDPSLNDVLNKTLINDGGITKIRLGDKFIQYSEDFVFFITTKLSNPHFSPEIAAITTIVNFAVKEQGLEEQLLGVVVQQEMPALEKRKSDLVLSMAEQRKQMVVLEDRILELLNSTDNILDDEQMVVTLNNSKETAHKISESLKIAKQTEIKIDENRNLYRAIARRASLLFFVLTDMSNIDTMYQFSLESYLNLFMFSIRNAKRTEDKKERINEIVSFHTLNFYRYICRALFERHKLLFSFQILVKILLNEKKIDHNEYSFFLKGGIVLDRKKQAPNPQKWLPQVAWDNLWELDKIASMHGIASSFESSTESEDWMIWYKTERPEAVGLPGEWDSKLGEFQKMLVIRSLRQDRLLSTISHFIASNLGPEFIEPPAFNLAQTFEDSNSLTPLIFILAPGVDPSHQLNTFALSSGMEHRFVSVALGQGQTPKAEAAIQEGMKRGNWVLLVNCHLSVKWLPVLDKLLYHMVQNPNDIHPDFRLWLTSNPHPKFPIAILQRSLKITTEAPKGVKANLLRIYGNMSASQYNTCDNTVPFRRLLFALSFFHSVLLERKKFMSLGWAVVYDFSDADFNICFQLLVDYLNRALQSDGNIDWKGLRYLTGEANYGGRVTDDWDRRILLTYMNEVYNDNIAFKPQQLLSESPAFVVPEDGNLSDFLEFINGLPLADTPEVFGQHFNADIASTIDESNSLLQTIIDLQPRTGGAGGQDRESKVYSMCEKLEDTIPKPIDYHSVVVSLEGNVSPLSTVLLQEITRYNVLLEKVHDDLIRMKRGIKGLEVISPDLEEIFDAYHDNRVPTTHSFCYQSQKSLASWAQDLVGRVEQLRNWAESLNPPTVFWLGGFTFPTGFLTALLQTTARRHGIPIDTLSFEFIIMEQSEHEILSQPDDGAYIKGILLEGARWDDEELCITDPEPMILIDHMPIIHFKPVQNHTVDEETTYICPCYCSEKRIGTRERPAFVCALELPCGESTPQKWIKRGTAALLSRADVDFTENH